MLRRLPVSPGDLEAGCGAKSSNELRKCERRARGTVFDWQIDPWISCAACYEEYAPYDGFNNGLLVPIGTGLCLSPSDTERVAIQIAVV